MKKEKKDTVIHFAVKMETREMLRKLAKIHDRSMTGVIEQLIKKESKEYGLIESRD